MIVRPYSIVLDAEALSALAMDDRRLQAWATFARRSDSVIYASCLTLAEVTDGTTRDAAVRRAVKAVRLVDVSPDIAYRAGRLRAAAAQARRKLRDLTVDAVVAATSAGLPKPVVVLTSDPDDLRLLLEGQGVKVEVV